MTNSIARTMRFSFVTLLLGLTVFTVAESALGGSRADAQAAAEGLPTCGTEAQPYTLEPVAVVAEPAPNSSVMLANEGLAACGSEKQPCVLEPIAIEAERETTRLASAERRLPRMMVRVGS